MAAILEKLRSQQDQLAGRGSPVKQGRLGDSLARARISPVLPVAGGYPHQGVLPDGRHHPERHPAQEPEQRLRGAGDSCGQREQRRHHLLRHVHRAEDTETPVKLKVMNDLPAYQDGYVTPTTAEIKDREEQLATIEKLLNESLTKEELKSLIATTEKQSTTASAP